MLKDKYKIDNKYEKPVTNKGLLFIIYQITLSNYRERQKR